MAGWIKWYRSAELNSVLNDGAPFDKLHAFLWMVESAAPKATIRNGVRLKRGQLWTTYRFMKDTWHWGSTHTVSKFLNDLENDKMIRVKRNKMGTLVTIEKYTSYQDSTNTNGTQNATQNATINKKKEGGVSNSDDLTPPNKDPRYFEMEVGEADVL